MFRAFIRCLTAIAIAAHALPAWPHAVLLASEPPDGAAMRQPPPSVRLTFNEPVRPVSLRLVDGSGRDWIGDARLEAADASVIVPVPAGLPEGGYLLSFRVISEDAHPASGSIWFRVGDGVDPKRVASNSSEATDAARVVSVLVRIVALLATAVAAGGALFSMFVSGADPVLGSRRTIAVAAFIAAAGAIAAIGLQGVMQGGLNVGDLLLRQAWISGLESSRAMSSGVAVIGLAMIGSAGWIRPRLSAAMLVAGPLLVAASFALAGHGATALPRGLAASAWTLHALAALFWIGSLAQLLRQSMRVPAADAALWRRFSRVALAAVGALLVCGILMAAIQIGGIAGIRFDSYVSLLAMKLVGVVILLALAAANRCVLLPRAEAGDARAAAGLRATTRVELAVGAIVISLAVSLAQQKPPRSATVEPPPWQEVAGAASYRARIRFEPVRAGHEAGLRVEVMQANGDPIDAPTGRVLLSHEGAGVEAMMRNLERVDRGTWRYQGPELVIPGLWTIEIEILVNDFEQAAFRTGIVVP